MSVDTVIENRAVRAPGTAARRRKPANRRRVWPFLLPSAIVCVLVLLLPLAYALYLSFFNYYLDTGASTFVGLGNYTDLLGEASFWASLARTLAIVVSAVGLEFCV